MTSLSASYDYCRRVARARARNFYYSFVLLSKERKAAMCAIYAFMRYCDDLSDEPGASAAPIREWRAALERALVGQLGDHPLWPAFHDTAARFRIPHQYFFDMIDGVESDLAPRDIRTFADLYAYCYRVASVVGMTTVHVFGFTDPNALVLAEKCGIAFQLTNILRDLREDAELGRVYLPAEDLERFGVAPAELRGTRRSAAFLRLMEFEADRARAYYSEAQPLVGMVDRASRRSLWALIAIYSRLLDKIRASGFDVLSRRVSLSAWEKLAVVARAFTLNSSSPPR